MQRPALHRISPDARARWRGRTVRDAVAIAWDVDEAHDPVALDEASAARPIDLHYRPSVRRVAADPERLLQAGLVSYAVPYDGELLLTVAVEDLVAAEERALLRAYLDPLPREASDAVPALRALRHYVEHELDAIPDVFLEHEACCDDGLVPALLLGHARGDVVAALAAVARAGAESESTARAAVFGAWLSGDPAAVVHWLADAERQARAVSSDAFVPVALAVWDVLGDESRALALVARAERAARPWFAALFPRAATVASVAHLAAARARFRIAGDVAGARAALAAAASLTRRSAMLTLGLAGDVLALLDDRALAAELIDRARADLGPDDEDLVLAERHVLGRRS